MFFKISEGIFWKTHNVVLFTLIIFTKSSNSSFDKKYQKHAIILKQAKSIQIENGKIYKRNTEKFFPIIMMPV